MAVVSGVAIVAPDGGRRRLGDPGARRRRAASVVGLLAGAAIVAGRGQLDGDGLGASVELTLVATLAACAIATP